jgi:hypothetical protein
LEESPPLYKKGRNRDVALKRNGWVLLKYNKRRKKRCSRKIFIMSMSISHTRRRNLLLQLNLFMHSALDAGQETGAVTDFAQRIGVHKSLLSKLKGEGQSSRDISDALARQIEAALGLSKGWMDEVHEEAPPTPAETSFIELALAAYRATDAKGRTEMRRTMRLELEAKTTKASSAAKQNP